MPAINDDKPEWFAQAIATPSIDESMTVEGCKIAFRRWTPGSESAPGVLFVHGGGGHSHWWDHVAPFLTATNAVAAIDLSGHGDSGRREVYRWEHWGKEIMAVAATLSSRASAPVIVGHSLGGRATVKSAAMAGDRIRGIVLVDSSVGTVWPEKHRLPSHPTPPRLYPTESAILERFRLRPAQETVLPFVLDHIARTSIRRAGNGWMWKVDPNTRDQGGDIEQEILAELTCEIAYVRGEHGRVTPHAARQLREVLNRSVPVIEIPGAHHHVMVDEPLPLVAALRSVLALWDHVALAAPPT